MLNAVLGTTKQLANADQDTRATPMSGVDSTNASQTPSVLTTWPAAMRNA